MIFGMRLGNFDMVERTLISFNVQQDDLIRLILKTPLTGEVIRSGCFVDPISKKPIAGVCEVMIYPFADSAVHYIMGAFMDDEESKRNQELCLKYGLIKLVPKN